MLPSYSAAEAKYHIWIKAYQKIFLYPWLLQTKQQQENTEGSVFLLKVLPVVKEYNDLT